VNSRLSTGEERIPGRPQGEGEGVNSRPFRARKEGGVNSRPSTVGGRTGEFQAIHFGPTVILFAIRIVVIVS